MKTLSCLLIGLLFSACGDPGHYYMLAPAGKAPARGGPAIGIGPITLADYLVERPYLVFQSTPTRMEVSDKHQWVGDLGSNFSRALGTDLGFHMGTGNIRHYPWSKESELRYQVVVDVSRFHGTADGDAVLEASWRVYSLPAGQLLTSTTSTLHEPLTADGFENLAEAQSRLVDQLAVRISAALR
ncbi:MAG: PqiC family protein [Akkermansiaceae bacterium]|nr:PqiC family protein [Akkermansiaceae bacterium]MCF7731933.1 PqiC family protein [Akkermansiaceae bacterium]